MQTSQSFYHQYKLNTRQRLQSEHIRNISHLQQEIQPWSYMNHNASARYERRLVHKTEPSNLKKIIILKNRLKENSKGVYKLPKINPYESYEPPILSRRSKTEGQQFINKNKLSISQPFKQMKDRLNLQKMKHPFFFPQMGYQRKEPIKSMCLALQKYKKIRIKQAQQKQHGKDGENANQNRYSLMSNFKFSCPEASKDVQKSSTLISKIHFNSLKKRTPNTIKSIQSHRLSAQNQKISHKSIFQS